MLDPNRKVTFGVWHPQDKEWLKTLQRHYTEYTPPPLQLRQLLASVPIGGDDDDDDVQDEKNVYYNAESNVHASCHDNKHVSDAFKHVKQSIRIPKTIHQIWLGSAWPKKYTMWADTWRKFHPHWEYKLWTDADVPTLDLINQDAFDRATNYGQKSDILRYEILYQLGGLYVDTDFECRGPFDVLHQALDFYTGVSNTGTIELNNGLVASVAGHPILHQLIKRIRNPPFPNKDVLALITQAHAAFFDPSSLHAIKKVTAKGADAEETLRAESYRQTITETGPGLFTRTFMDGIQPHDGFLHPKQELPYVMAFPANYFYPIPNNHHSKLIASVKKGEGIDVSSSLAVHHWEKAWQQRISTQ